MIVFDLKCSNGHGFEGWFKDIDSFNEQNSMGMINCPLCKDTNITKVLSPVAIKSSPEGQTGEITSKNNSPDYGKLAMGIVEYVKNNFDDVGTNFATEALKIYYGITKKRNIRGTATAKEEQALKDEGIKFTKVPFIKLKDDNN
jgi:hypothetical protein